MTDDKKPNCIHGKPFGFCMDGQNCKPAKPAHRDFFVMNGQLNAIDRQKWRDEIEWKLQQPGWQGAAITSNKSLGGLHVIEISALREAERINGVQDDAIRSLHRQHHELTSQLTAAKARIEEYELWEKSIPNYLQIEIRLKNERERLRAALEEIKAHRTLHNPNFEVLADALKRQINKIKLIAIVALSGEDK